MKREEVYKLIDEERSYQNDKPPRPKSDEDTSVAEWLVYIEMQLTKAKAEVYFLKEREVLGHVRKIAALAVACMENNNTPLRRANLKGD